MTNNWFELVSKSVIWIELCVSFSIASLSLAPQSQNTDVIQIGLDPNVVGYGINGNGRNGHIQEPQRFQDKWISIFEMYEKPQTPMVTEPLSDLPIF